MSEENKIEFEGCKYLDYEPEYIAKRQIISVRGGYALCWLRDVDPDLPSLVQFCKKRGRLNNPDACLSEDKAICGDYENYNHNIIVPLSETDTPPRR